MEFVETLGEGWPDKALARMLLRRADDSSSDTPLVSSFSAPHEGRSILWLTLCCRWRRRQEGSSSGLQGLVFGMYQAGVYRVVCQ